MKTTINTNNQIKKRRTYFFSSSIGMKYVMAITGLIWAGFVLVHMLGNMLLFFGGDVYNSYSHALASSKLIYLAEAILVISLFSHVVMAVRLTIMNNAALTLAYAMPAQGFKKTSLIAKTLIYQGTIILFFIIIHLINLKYGQNYQTVVSAVPMRDLHKLVLELFQNPYYVGGYLFCLLILGLHLSYGISSAMQSLGDVPAILSDKEKKTLSYIYAVLVIIGYMAQPLYVYITTRSTVHF